MLPKSPLRRSLILGAIIGAIASAGIIGLMVALQPQSGPGLLVCLGCGGNEALNGEGASLNSPTNMTLNLRSTGSLAVTLIAYYVKDPGGNTYSKTSWSGPTIPTNSVAVVYVLIDGKAFSFQSGSVYTVEFVTSRNNIFTLTVTA